MPVSTGWNSGSLQLFSVNGRLGASRKRPEMPQGHVLRAEPVRESYYTECESKLQFMRKHPVLDRWLLTHTEYIESHSKLGTEFEPAAGIAFRAKVL